jgi:hypothetical protein
MNAVELIEILEDPDQWSRFDVAAAKILLQEKGINISGKKIKIMTAAKENELKSQRTLSNSSLHF